MTVNCHLCNEPFEADPEQVDAWGNSGQPFDPTDWECEACRVAYEHVCELNAALADIHEARIAQYRIVHSDYTLPAETIARLILTPHEFLF